MVARRACGEMATYDPVEMVVDPKLNLLDYLIAPARVNANVSKAAQELAKRRLNLLQHLDCLVSNCSSPILVTY